MYSEILKLSDCYYNLIYTKEYRIFKLASSAINMGDPVFAGRGIAEIVKFLLKRIDVKNRGLSQEKLKYKIWNMNEFQLSSKKSPNSAAIGNSISFVKNVLNGNNPDYIRAILKEIVRNL